MEAEVHILNGLQSADRERSLDGPSSRGQGDALSKSNAIKLGLEKNISEASRQKIYGILEEVNKLSDVEKLLLYMKLPTGVTSSPSSTASETGFHRDEHQKALRWLRTHLEEDSGTCVQKQELFDQYRSFCERHHYRCVNQFDFGKLLRYLFPRLKLRHLGQRGQSKTCYGGLKNCDQLKAPTVPKLDIIDNERNKVLTDRLGEDSSITQAACELVCEWAQKLHDNKHFSSIQELAEHLISSCVVSTHSTAAFTIIAAAQRDDRNIMADSPDTAQGNSSGSGDQSNSRSALQPKTQQQLQRTLKGRKMLREQKEKMECQTMSVLKSSPSMATTHTSTTPTTASRQDNRSILATKKTSTVQSQKNILPKCNLVSEFGAGSRISQQPCQIQVVSEENRVMVSPLATNTTMSSVTSSGQLFVLPSDITSTQMGQKTSEASQLIHSHQMVILSPLKPAPTQVVTISKDKSPVTNLQSSMVKSIVSNASIAPATNKSNSTLAMLLTEKLDNDCMVLPSSGSTQCKVSGPQNMVKLVRAPSIESNGSLHTSLSSSQPSGDRKNSTLISSNSQSGKTLRQNESSNVVPVTTESSGTRMTSSLEHGSQSATISTSKSNKGKRKMTPPKNRQSSKTVSTLLKETRGYGPLSDTKAFVNDRRPVSQLLKESRQRRTSGEENNASCIVIAPATRTQPVSITLATPVVVANQQVTVGSAVMHGPAVSMPSPPADIVMLKQSVAASSNSSVKEESKVKPETACVTQTNVTQTSAQSTQGTPIQFSGSTQMPFAKEIQDLIHGTDQCPNALNIDGGIHNQSLQNFSKLMQRALNEQAAHQDGNNNKDLREDKANAYNLLSSNMSHSASSVSDAKDEVSVTNIENDALNEYLGSELSSDLADITPSLTMDSHPATDEDHLSSGPNVSQNYSNQAFVMQNQDPFMCFQESQKRSSSEMLSREEDGQYGQRPASEQMVQNPDVYSLPVSTALTRPSTMPPKLDITYSNSLQKLLAHTQPSLCIGDQNSTDSFSGYNTPGQMTPASQPALTRSPSLCSAPSTPSSLLSPPDRFNSAEPTNSFMPIQGSTGSLQLDQVSPIRPMVRNMASSESHPACKYPNSKTNMKDLPRFTNPAALVNSGGSFVPYSTASGEQTVTTTNSFNSPVAEQHDAQQSVNRKQDHFLPASFIRPVKRPMAVSQQGGQKRVRHRSAQDAKSLYKAQAKNKANKYNMLTSLLKSGSNPCQPSIQTAMHKGQPTNRPNNLPRPLPSEEMGSNLSSPQSPFSPEVENIMAGDEHATIESPDVLGLNVFRSHSVPAQSLQRAGSETPDFISQLLPGQQQQQQQQQNQDMAKMNINMDISSLLQEQIPDDQSRQPLEFGARRNINSLLNDEGSCIDNFYSPSVRGDHMISGASVRTSQQQQMNAISSHFLDMEQASKLASYSNSGVGTPPPSQNPTPDFSTELSAMGDNGSTFSVGRAASNTLIDTPNSLDTLATQDSQESLKEDFLTGMCVESICL